MSRNKQSKRHFHRRAETATAESSSQLQRKFCCRMSFEDFARHFTHLDLVHIGPDDWMSEPALHSKQPWRAVLARRRWRSGYNAGGGPTYTGEQAFTNAPTPR